MQRSTLACATLILLLSTSCNESAAERVGVVLGKSANEGSELIDDAARLGLSSEDDVARTVEENRSFLDDASARLELLIRVLDAHERAEAVVDEAMCNLLIEYLSDGQLPSLDDLVHELISVGFRQGDVGSGMTSAAAFISIVDSSPDGQSEQIRVLMLEHRYCS